MLQPKHLFCLKNSYKYFNFILLNLSFSSWRGASAKTAVLVKKQLQILKFLTSQPFLFLITWCFSQNIFLVKKQLQILKLHTSQPFLFLITWCFSQNSCYAWLTTSWCGGRRRTGRGETSSHHTSTELQATNHSFLRLKLWFAHWQIFSYSQT